MEIRGVQIDGFGIFLLSFEGEKVMNHQFYPNQKGVKQK